MNWLGSSFPDAMNRLPLVLAVLFFVLYVAMLWLLLFRRPSFRKLSGQDRWSVLTSVFGVMLVWVFFFFPLSVSMAFSWRGLLSGLPATVSVPRSFLLILSAHILAWPFVAWVAFRIAFRRFEPRQRRQAISSLFMRVTIALLLALSFPCALFHFVVAGRHSFDHLLEAGPRNIAAILDWAQNEPIDYGDGYRVRFPVRDNCPLCRLEPILGRKQAEDWRAKEAEFISHAEFAESESHAESAEIAESAVRDGSTSRPGEEGLKE